MYNVCVSKLAQLAQLARSTVSIFNKNANDFVEA